MRCDCGYLECSICCPEGNITSFSEARERSQGLAIGYAEEIQDDTRPYYPIYEESKPIILQSDMILRESTFCYCDEFDD